MENEWLEGLMWVGVRVPGRGGGERMDSEFHFC